MGCTTAPTGPSPEPGLRRALAPVGLGLFTILTVLLAWVAVHQGTVAQAGLWPHAYFLAIAIQWGALGVACVGLCVQGAQPWFRPRRAAPGSRSAPLVALLLFHGLVAMASVVMGFADALVGGHKLPGFVVDLLPREDQLLMLMAAMWILLVVATGFLWLYHHLAPQPLRHHAFVVAGTLFTGAVAYWGWGWSRFYPTLPGEWFSLWKVGALDIAVEGNIFRFLLVALPAAHMVVVGWLSWQLLGKPGGAVPQAVATKLRGASSAPRAAPASPPPGAPPEPSPPPPGNDAPS